MQDFLKFFCVFMILIFLVPLVFGAEPVSLREKLVAVQHTADGFDPLPSFPEFPNTPTGDDTFFNQIGNFFRYVASIGRWVAQFIKWTFDSVLVVIRILGIFLLNRMPEVMMI